MKNNHKTGSGHKISRILQNPASVKYEIQNRSGAQIKDTYGY